RSLKAGVLPPIDTRFSGALLGNVHGDDAWTPLVRQTAADFVGKKQRVAVVYLAWQCRQLGDPALANNLLAVALAGPAEETDAFPVRWAAIDYLWSGRQYERAERMLQGLLENEQWQRAPALWRLASRFAAERGNPARSVECLERALDLEYQDLPE